MTIDVARARADTPGSERAAHLNCAGAALPPRPVVDAVTEHLRLEAELGGYEAAERAAGRVERVYEAAAALLNCAPEEIAFVENATRAWDMAFYSLRFGPGDRILTSMAEYASNYVAFLQVARRTAARIEAVPNDETGQLSVDALERMLDERVKLVAITHIPTNGGLVNPAAAIGALTSAAGVPFLLDACQSAGQLPLDVAELRCDLLSLTGRKYLRGPRGTGLLYARRELAERLEPPFVDLRAAPWVAGDRYELAPGARRFEGWEAPIAGKIGLGAAIDYALGWGVDAIWARVRHLADVLRARLAEIPGIVVRDVGRERCGIVSFTVDGEAPRAVRARLAADGIHVWFSETPSTRLDMEARGLDAVVRASVHYYNTEEEVDALCRALR